MAFSYKLKETRGNLTDIEIARICKVSISTVDRWMRGKTAPASGQMQEAALMAISKARKSKNSS